MCSISNSTIKQPAQIWNLWSRLRSKCYTSGIELAAFLPKLSDASCLSCSCWCPAWRLLHAERIDLNEGHGDVRACQEQRGRHSEKPLSKMSRLSDSCCGPWNWFLSPGKPNASSISTPSWRVFEGFLKAFWRVSRGPSAGRYEGPWKNPSETPSDTLHKPFQKPSGVRGSVAGNESLD